MLSSSAQHAASTPPDGAAVLEQLERVLGSTEFSGSDHIRKLLVFLTHQAIDHPGINVKEYELATEALGREPDFDPREDSAVRVAACRLRSKLAEYYTHGGADDPILFDLPKGIYALSITSRPSNPAIGPEPARAIPTAAPRWLAALIAAAAALFAVGGYLAGRASRAPAIDPVARAFWSRFASGRRPPLIVYSNPRFRGTPTTGLQLVSAPERPDGPVIDVFTGIGEVAAAQTLGRQLAQLGASPRLKRAQLFTWDEAAESHLVFLGGYSQNNAVRDMPQLQKFNIKSDAEEPFAEQAAVTASRPEQGEQPYYVGSRDLSNGIAYAIVALLPGASPAHRILVLAGTSTHGTEGAATFVCRPDRLTELFERLGVPSGGNLPAFEALLEVPVRGGTPLSARLLRVYRRS